jgi:ketosteroid isomerase-like protein
MEAPLAPRCNMRPDDNPGETAMSDGHHIATLEKLNDDYIRSVATSDVKRFGEILAEDFLNSNPDGSLSDKAQFLANISKLAGVSGLKCEDVRIRVMGGFAIIHGRTTYRKPDGQPGAGRYTDMWALRDGRWLCVAAHVTRG